DRVAWRLLRCLRYWEGRGDSQRISLRTLGVEGVGRVYESLLGDVVARASEPTLGLIGKREPGIPLSQLEELRAGDESALFDFLKRETGGPRKWRNYLDVELSEETTEKLRDACDQDEDLFRRVRPFAALIRGDSFGRPMVIRASGAFLVAGTNRRVSGAHYTPVRLAEPIVEHALDPLCYVGPAQGKPRDRWRLRSPEELLALTICDMACGSGAFLIQACRRLAGLLVQAWEEAERPTQRENTAGSNRSASAALPSASELDQPIPSDSQLRFVHALRLIAGRCLHGVDKNPLAVETAKFSLRLLTTARGKPPVFLDHALRCGDALVGITDLDEMARL
ncbi:MAG: hypothetical protein N2C14_09250, partial [Planctomycetales bacterium]